MTSSERQILARPEIYIGSLEVVEREVFVLDAKCQRMVKRARTYVPGLLKIFDEILGKSFCIYPIYYPEKKNGQ